MKKVLIYKGYERFWHWTQALLILLLALTGFEVHGTYHLMDYDKAVFIHQNLAWAFMVLIVFTQFWNFTTGEWRQYIPTTKLLKAQVAYYITGIFKHAPHPTRKTVYNKFNPLQRLTYLGLRLLIIPVVVFSGILYMYYVYFVDQGVVGDLAPIAYFHTLGAYLLIGFVIAHVYLTTTGHRPLSAIKAMIVGWEEMSDEDARVALEENLKVALVESRKSVSGAKEADKKEMFEVAIGEVAQKLGINMEGLALREKLLHSNVGYFRINKQGLYEEVNNVWLDLYKCTSKALVIGSHVTLDRTEPEKIRIMQLVDQVLAGGTVTGERIQRLCKDGSIGYHTVSATYYKDETGKIAGLEGFIIDITHQVEAEEELEKKISKAQSGNDFYSKIYCSEGVGYFKIDKEGFYQDVNPTWLKLYKFTEKDEIVGKHYSLSRTKEDFIRLKATVDKVLKGQTIPLDITRRFCKDGSTGYHSITMTPVYEGDEITGFEGFIVDKTDTKLAEAELLHRKD
ncbi:MAG: cytochrome b/b6 domain-containing protein [Bacteroidales bacterium]|nr:cytochrome b/b6 domain-containing protein [Bacteroidales bacterium]